jgi:hypothetical protein
MRQVVTRTEPADNGAGPTWCYGSSIVVRAGLDVFASVIGLFLWATEHFVLPRLAPRDEVGGPAAALRITGFYGAAAMLGSFSAALLLHRTLIPGLLGSPRSVLLFSSYALIFNVLFLGLAVAATFYRRVEDRVRADQELRLARRIQSSFLPTEFPALPG